MSLVWRWIMTALIGFGLIGGGYYLYARFVKEETVRIAVESATADDALLLGAINEWMTGQGRRYRIRLVPASSPAHALEMLRGKRVEIASVRADTVSGADISSMMVIFREVAVLLAPKGSPVTSWNSLSRRPLGLTGGTVSYDPLLKALLKSAGVDEPMLVQVPPENVHDELTKRTILATVFIGPVPGANLRNLRRLGSMRNARTVLNAIELPDSEALAARDKRYTSETIPAGALRPNPPLPDEGIDTLGVSRHLMVRSSVPPLVVTRVLRDFLDAARALQVQHPLLAQAGAPSVEADAFVKVHKGPRAFFNGEDRGLVEVLLDWVYVVPLAFGAIGTLIAWAVGWLSPRKITPSDELIARSLEIRREAGAANETRALSALRTRLEQIAGQLESTLHQVDPAEAGGVLTAIDLCERRIAARQAELDAIVKATGRAL